MPTLAHIVRRLRLPCVALCLLLALPVKAQQSCRDTLVYLVDSICDGETYDFNGRPLTYTGIFFDTLPRHNSDCDSILVLRLTVLDVYEVLLYPFRRCRGNVGYDIYSSNSGRYYQWTSDPLDTALARQQHNPWIHVNPQTPTTYSLYVDYRISPPQCPTTGSRTVNPIAVVVGNMHVYPDELTLDHMEFTVEDFSTGTREYHWGGWGGRHWYINGQHQSVNNEQVTFTAEPWWPDTVEVMMEGFTPTCLDTVIKKIPFKKISLYFPNVFTPDKETNNLFRPYLMGVTDFEMWIFDRHGKQVFHTRSADEPWDGTFQGVPLPEGSYVYRCRYIDIYTPTGYQTLNGTVTLLR